MLSATVLTKIEQLQRMLTSSTVKLPIYVGFQTEKNILTLGITSLQGLKASVAVVTGNNCHVVIGLTEIVDVFAFRDAIGVSLFLTDFEGGEFSSTRYKEENDRYERLLLEEIREWQEEIYDLVHAHNHRNNTIPIDDLKLVTVFSREGSSMYARSMKSVISAHKLEQIFRTCEGDSENDVEPLCPTSVTNQCIGGWMSVARS